MVLVVFECNNGFHRKYQIYIYFEALPKSLMTFLESRSKRNIFSERTNTSPNFLVEKELYNIIIQIIDVMEYLQTQQISHGDIRSETCFINDQGNIVLCDRKLYISRSAELGKVWKSRKQNVINSTHT